VIAFDTSAQRAAGGRRARVADQLKERFKALGLSRPRRCRPGAQPGDGRARQEGGSRRLADEAIARAVASSSYDFRDRRGSPRPRPSPREPRSSGARELAHYAERGSTRRCRRAVSVAHRGRAAPATSGTPTWSPIQTGPPGGRPSSSSIAATTTRRSRCRRLGWRWGCPTPASRSTSAGRSRWARSRCPWTRARAC
jgi:hypothetical protein